jgi:N-acetyl-anhydromuramyl-L-alanine amidase AmpD
VERAHRRGAVFQRVADQAQCHPRIEARGRIDQFALRPQAEAGGGRWGTITDINSASIGIELDNDGSTPFAPAQIDSLLRLLADLTTRLHIPRTQIVGHEDFAPTRKDDPGPLFPWQQLAAAGFGLWPQGELIDPPAGFDPWMALGLVGYPLEDRAATVRAFHNHYRGIGGDALDAQDLRILYNLAQAIERGQTPAD